MEESKILSETYSEEYIKEETFISNTDDMNDDTSGTVDNISDSVTMDDGPMVDIISGPIVESIKDSVIIEEGSIIAVIIGSNVDNKYDNSTVGIIVVPKIVTVGSGNTDTIDVGSTVVAVTMRDDNSIVDMVSCGENNESKADVSNDELLHTGLLSTTVVDILIKLDRVNVGWEFANDDIRRVEGRIVLNVMARDDATCVDVAVGVGSTVTRFDDSGIMLDDIVCGTDDD